jgi:ribosomal-protein-alanine N-acetyltransferase
MPPDLPSTDRLILRPHTVEDAAYLMALNADPEVVRYTGDGPFASLEGAAVVATSLARQYAERRLGRFVVVERRSGRAIGWCGLRWHDDEGAADLGFRLSRDRWGEGFATEAARACLTYGDALGIGIFARAMPANAASVRVLHKLGFRETASAPDGGFIGFERN